jgi:hypothetical protein
MDTKYNWRVRYVRNRVEDIIDIDDYENPESKDIIEQHLAKIRNNEYKNSKEAIKACVQELEIKMNKQYNYNTSGRPRKYAGDKKQRYYASLLHNAAERLGYNITPKSLIDS